MSGIRLFPSEFSTSYGCFYRPAPFLNILSQTFPHLQVFGIRLFPREFPTIYGRFYLFRYGIELT